ncbi:uncharacterized protein LOC109844593 [Asparagus officinalis]|uniref:uncharacterized protein LOC109844593 n=1 Tax=Asparagus officinalis TaxID=4686 RepID=UPI00098DF82C|nr:uncharacterized protein LOC109844593 [Asparagus officinalis]
MVMLLGHSTGKTTFIKHFLRSSYLGVHIGPEPATDRFIVVMSQDQMKGVFLETLLLCRHTCLIMILHHLELHFFQNLSGQMHKLSVSLSHIALGFIHKLSVSLSLGQKILIST